MDFVTDRSERDLRNYNKKAYINADDLNRIEGNTATIAKNIGVRGLTTYTDWKPGDFIYPDDFKRIRDNVETVKEGFLTLAESPDTPIQPLNTYQKWNDIETILWYIEIICEANDKYYYCDDELFSDEEVGIL